MRRVLLTLIAVVAVSVFVFVLALPPRPARLDAGSAWSDLAPRTVAGAYHVHTTRSDGSADTATVAASAARAGLTFVIFTDHGDATRPPDPPAYIYGVLCLDAVEISTDEGHYVAIDMPRAPYPLGGSAVSVVEDVRRLGGFGVAAHPDSPKSALHWTAPDLPIDGIEWLNADSEWRSKSRRQLARAALAYLVRPAPALVSLLDRPQTLDRWDRLSAGGRVVALAGADAHGGIGTRAEDGSRSGVLGIPSYESSFRAFSNRVILDRPPTGNAATDARALYQSLRAGRIFTTIDALAAPGLLDFHADGGAVVARALMPRGAQLILFRAGQEVARTDGDLRWDTGGTPGAYRVEVHVATAPGAPPVPWLVSNAIHVGAQGAGETAQQASQAPPAPVAPQAPLLPWPWRIEKEASSSAIVRTNGDALTLEYELGGGEARSQFVALASDLHAQTFRAIDIGLSAAQPMRVSVQVRRQDGARWGRSFYVDSTETVLRAELDALRPFGTVSPEHPDPTTITSVLLVIDLTNASPGHRGTLRVRGAALE